MRKIVSRLAALLAASLAFSLHAQTPDAASARVIVKLRADAPLLKAAQVGAPPQDMRAAALGGRIGVTLRSGSRLSERAQVVFGAGISSAELAQRLAREHDIEYAMPDERRHVYAAPNDPLYPDGQGGNGPSVSVHAALAPYNQGPMRILLSNDDGYFAPGLEHLAAALAPHAELTVVAPERDRSGASNSLTLDRPLNVRRAPNGFLFVNGTPTDCVHLAVTGLLEQMPDMVISGINLGANMGDDTIYSGTVAAATEGYLLGVPSLAISLTSKTAAHFETAAAVAVELVERHRRGAAGPWLLNINVPDVPRAALKGYRVTRLGRRHKAEDVIKTTSPRGETVYWVGAAGPAADAGEGTDFHAVEAGYVSITPLQIDLTNRDQLPAVARWFES